MKMGDEQIDWTERNGFSFLFSFSFPSYRLPPKFFLFLFFLPFLGSFSKSLLQIAGYHQIVKVKLCIKKP